MILADRMTTRLLIVLAGLMGAGGVILAAAGAHLPSDAALGSAADMLLFHATAVLGGVALLRQRLLCRPAALIAIAAWILGASLFAADIAMRAYAGHRLFPHAAPSGGTLLIVGWFTLVGAAIFAPREPS
jgi:uncharacterized membrane protein YgdD (TMEM256/DUF423 family)